MTTIVCGYVQGFSYVQYSIPELVDKAELIVIGTIATTGEPTIQVEKYLKSNGSNQLLLGMSLEGLQPYPEFIRGVPVMLFLNSPDETGRAYLFGLRDQSQWPKPERLDTYARADVADLERIVVAAQTALAGSTFDEYGRGVIAMLQSKDELLQLAGLDLALSELTSRSWKSGRAWPDAYSQIAAYALPLLDSPNKDIRGRAIQLVGHAPNAVAAPALIPLITDPDKWCRSQVRVALGRVVTNCKMNDPLIMSWQPSPSNLQPIDGSEEVKIAFENAWQMKKDKRQAIALTRLREGLTSSSRLARESTTILLSYIGVSQ